MTFETCEICEEMCRCDEVRPCNLCGRLFGPCCKSIDDEFGCVECLHEPLEEKEAPRPVAQATRRTR